ncbi:uncharacterized protein LOC109715647 [Ananas comosus]|uniref:Uncharacterized protein LOC109715647 n=1 Tax=Ananas comosus TaxID=4615 RepID=A0A6P5FJ52_ANACO|nr:uncharacterized protein LOC109715647 [Ananas comosus]XP_020096350.1 uncharacterized protein LOC109715647 [Ananas comosus]XP_020096351.1 uncharacterized protein LOC109715647 [Ananas comosus]
MPFQIKIQPMDSKQAARGDPAKQGGRSRLKRLFERQLPSVLMAGGEEREREREREREKERDEGKGEGEPSSVGLDRMVLSFIEESNDRPPRGRCNCFNGHHDDSSDDELDLYFADAPRSAAAAAAVAPVDAAELLKGLVPCTSVAERNLLADASKILDRSKGPKGKDNSRSLLADGLRTLGYDAAICKSRWDRTPSYPAGEHEYVDVVVVPGGRRLIVEVDFRSEFEIARSTKAYRAALQSLPPIFVGSSDRLAQIVSLLSDAARLSLKKKGLHFPPWRKSEYMRAKWLSPFLRLPEPPQPPPKPDSPTPFDLLRLAHAALPPPDDRITVLVVSAPPQPEVVTTGFASDF